MTVTNKLRRRRVGSITRPSPSSFQARIIRLGASRSRSFLISDYDGAAEAYAAAEQWLERVAATMAPAKPFRPDSNKNKRSDLPAGVCMMLTQREPTHSAILSLSVNWKDEYGRWRPKHFIIGPDGYVTDKQIACATRAALDFRNAFVAAYAKGEPFDPSPWRKWRERYEMRLHAPVTLEPPEFGPST